MGVGVHFSKLAECMLEYGPSILTAAAKHIEVVSMQ
jgi:hypothetical protein